VSGFLAEWKVHYQATREACEKKKAYMIALEKSQTRIPDYYDSAQPDPTSTIDDLLDSKQEDDIIEVGESKMPASTSFLVPETMVEVAAHMYTHSSRGVLGKHCDASELIRLYRSSDIMQVAVCFQKMQAENRFQKLMDDLDLPQLDGSLRVRVAKFNLCKDEFLRVTGLPDTKPRTKWAEYQHNWHKNNRSAEAKEKLKKAAKAKNEGKKAPCKTCGQSCIGEFAQVVTLAKKDGSGMFEHVFCVGTCSRDTCYRKCYKCGREAAKSGYYMHKDSDNKVVCYKKWCQKMPG
jgi:hypothetical protein